MQLTSTATLGLCLIVASLLPLSHGAQLYTAQQAYRDESSARQATVVDLQPDPAATGTDAGKQLYAVVEFTDDNGTRRRARTNVGSYPPPHQIGEIVNIRVHVQKQDDIRINSFTGMWFESVFFLVPGLLSLIAGLFMVFYKRTQ